MTAASAYDDRDASRYAHISDGEIRLLLSRLDDLAAEAGRGLAALSAYLTPREAKAAARHLSPLLLRGTAVLWGGYVGAERVRAVLLPDYAEGLVDPHALGTEPVTALREVGFDDLADAISQAVTPLCVRGSGYRALGHRDYLGSILALGVERDAIGDLLVADAAEDGARPTAYLFTNARMADFLAESLERVANDTVQVSRVEAAGLIIPERKLSPIRDTVASERLDCVVAALCNLSRDASQTAVRQGLVEVDYEPATACDRILTPPATITVRGYGKFRLDAFDGETRKGRVRLVAGKYV